MPQASEDHELFRSTVREFVEREINPFAEEWEETGVFPARELFSKMGSLGFLGLTYDPVYGGGGADYGYVCILNEELGRMLPLGVAMAIGVQTDMATPSLHRFGSHELKEQYLRPAITGEAVAAVAITEPDAGSDVAGIRTKAHLEGGEWVLNGAKTFITNGTQADWVCVVARTSDEGGSRGVSQILVPTDTPGVVIGPAEKKMGLNGSPTHAVTFDNARVPLGNLIGEEGRGLQQTLATLSKGRVSIGALALGLGQAAYERALAYAQQREAFGQPIANYQAIQFMLADAATELQAARLMLYYAAWLKDRGQPFATQAGMAKLFATEVSERVCRNAIQIHGGYGYSREFEVERIYRDTRLMSIGEGTSEIQRLIIARAILGD